LKAEIRTSRDRGGVVQTFTNKEGVPFRNTLDHLAGTRPEKLRSWPRSGLGCTSLGTTSITGGSRFIFGFLRHGFNHVLRNPLLKSFLRELNLSAKPEMRNTPPFVTIPEGGGRLTQELRSLLDVEDHHWFIVLSLVEIPTLRLDQNVPFRNGCTSYTIESTMKFPQLLT